MDWSLGMLFEGANWILSLLLLALGCAGLMWWCFALKPCGRALDPFAPEVFYPVAFALFYALGSLRLTAYERPVAAGLYQYYFVGLLAYYAGLVSVRAAVYRLMPGSAAPRCAHVWDRKLLARAIVGLFLLAMAAALYMILRAGLPVLSQDVENVRTGVVTQVGGYVLYLVDTMQIVLMLVFLYAATQSTCRRDKIALLCVCLVSLAVLGTRAARRLVVVPLLVGVVLYHYFRRRARVYELVMVGAAAAVLVGAAGYIRYVGARSIELEGVYVRLLQEIQRGGSALSLLVSVFPDKLAFMGWSGFLMPLKVILPGRQPSLGGVLKALLGREFRGGGFVPTVLGGFYICFGTAGVAVGMFGWGVLLAVLYLWAVRHGDEFRYLLYSYVAIYSLNAVRGNSISPWPLFVTGMLTLTHLYCTKGEGLPLRVRSWFSAPPA